ncbi:MAG: sugar transferase [Chloroflexi bacterium]|nr:sugar transferase [Chloroflexota bacterium]
MYGRVKNFDLFVYLLAKRALDIVGSGLVLVLLAPVFVLISLLIRADSPGNAIFAQERVGTRIRIRNGRKVWELYPFIVYKFRTMQQNTTSDLHREFVLAFINNDDEKMKALQNGKHNGMYKIVDDPRVTRIGKFLRKTSLDELPQFWNVFIGDMSLVGPRPALPYEVDAYTGDALRRLEAQPGLTGLWQISARSAVDFDRMVDLDVSYIEQQSLWMDLKILLKTPVAVLRGKGAA